MFKAALFIITPNWKQPDCSSLVNNSVNPGRIKVCPAIKRNTQLIDMTSWVNHTYIQLNERKQTRKVANCVISLMWHFRKGKTVETENG